MGIIEIMQITTNLIFSLFKVKLNSQRMESLEFGIMNITETMKIIQMIGRIKSLY